VKRNERIDYSSMGIQVGMVELKISYLDIVSFEMIMTNFVNVNSRL
jgi:hypothetical protein